MSSNPTPPSSPAPESATQRFRERQQTYQEARRNARRAGRGGKRPGAGRIQQRITLDLPAARMLREIVRLYTEEVRANTDVPDFHITPAEKVQDLIYIEAIRRGALGNLGPEVEARWMAIERGEDDAGENAK